MSYEYYVRNEWRYKEERQYQTEREAETERNHVLTIFRDTVELENKSRKPQNVIVLGVSGTGKSSFLNTAMTSLSDKRRWYERAQIGSFTDGRQSTLHLIRYARENYIADRMERMFCFPTFFDLAGLEDENSFTVQEMIRVIIFGRLGSRESLRNLKRYIDSCDEDREQVRRKYSKNQERNRIDRIIFLASARREIPLPFNLMEAVLDVAHSSEIVIPIFGLLTHCDLVEYGDKEFLKKEKYFKDILGLPNNRYMRCQNYCDEYDSVHGTNRIESAIPELDIPVIKFMTQICSPYLIPPSTEVIYYEPGELDRCQNRVRPSTEEVNDRPDDQMNDCDRAVVGILLSAIVATIIAALWKTLLGDEGSIALTVIVISVGLYNSYCKRS